MPGIRSLPVSKNCKSCCSEFKTTVKRAWRTHYCSESCKADWNRSYRAGRFEARMSLCVTCQVTFFPRSNQLKYGAGRFCSISCASKFNNAYKVTTEEDKRIKRNIWAKIRYAANPDRFIAAAKHYRSKNPDKCRAALRKYRANNPHKTKEWAHRRAKVKFGRLPKGTIEAIYHLQGGACNYCYVNLSNGYHVDHIMPLSRGWKHEADNIQLLCQHCNVSKSWKTPLEIVAGIKLWLWENDKIRVTSAMNLSGLLRRWRLNRLLQRGFQLLL